VTVNNQRFVAVIIHALIHQFVSMVLKCIMNHVILVLNVHPVVVPIENALILCNVMNVVRLIEIVCQLVVVAVKVTVLIRLFVMVTKGFGIIVILIRNVWQIIVIYKKLLQEINQVESTDVKNILKLHLPKKISFIHLLL
jgi:hypothetical protein